MKKLYLLLALLSACAAKQQIIQPVDVCRNNGGLKYPLKGEVKYRLCKDGSIFAGDSLLFPGRK
jgi:hypothetical protein